MVAASRETHMKPTQPAQSEAKNEIDLVKMPDVNAVLESDELTEAEQDRISGAGGNYGDDGSEGV
jgi:hypothetical protein